MGKYRQITIHFIFNTGAGLFHFTHAKILNVLHTINRANNHAMKRGQS